MTEPPAAPPRRSRASARGRGRVTLSDVAREAGVSLATASRAINGSPDRSVGADLLERVLGAARRLDYSPDANAQAVARGRTAMLGLIVHDITDPYFSALAAGVTQAADEAGLAVTLADANHDPDRELRFVQTLVNQRAQAIILAGGRQDDDATNRRLGAALAAYQRGGGSAAVIGQPVLGVNAVRADNEGGAAALAAALHGLGYRRIGVLAGPEAHLTARERVHGFTGELARLGTRVAPEAVVVGEFNRDGGHAGMTELLARDVDVDLVFAVNDVMALGAMAAARDVGRAVPGALALAGFDDIATLRDVTPGLTTVRIPMAEMGRSATALALAATSGESAVITVAGDVVLRDSTPAI